MTKQEFVAEVARRSQLTARDAGKAVDAFLDTITDTLKGGGDVSFTGFGKFSTQHRAARTGVNPRNPSEKVHIPAAHGAEVLGRQRAQGGRQERLTADPGTSPPRIVEGPRERPLAFLRRPGRAPRSDLGRTPCRRVTVDARSATGSPRRSSASAASSSSGSTRSPTCCRRARARPLGRDTPQRPGTVLLRDRRRCRAVRRRGQAAVGVLRGARRRRDARLRGGLRLRARRRAARDRRRASAATSARRPARTRPRSSSRAAAAARRRAHRQPVPRPRRDRAVPRGLPARRRRRLLPREDVERGRRRRAGPALSDGRRVWQHVAELVREWGEELVGERGLSAVGAVVGATYPARGRARRAGCCRSRCCCSPASARRAARPPTSRARSRAARRARSCRLALGDLRVPRRAATGAPRPAPRRRGSRGRSGRSRAGSRARAARHRALALRRAGCVPRSR